MFPRWSELVEDAGGPTVLYDAQQVAFEQLMGTFILSWLRLLGEQYTKPGRGAMSDPDGKHTKATPL